MLGRAIAAVLLLGAAGALRAQEGPPADDRYVFAANGGQETRVSLDPTAIGASFHWPEVPAGWDTALLGVRVAGSAPAVSVEVRAGSAVVVNDLDAQARGLRWLTSRGSARSSRRARAWTCCSRVRRSTVRRPCCAPAGLHGHPGVVRRATRGGAGRRR